MSPTALTPKQQHFCDEYLTDMNATRAALRAGYSVNTALNGKLMTIPKIKMYLQERMQQVSRNLQVNQEMLVAELCKIAFANMGSYFGPDGKIKPMQDMSDTEKAAIWSFSVANDKEGTTVKLRLNNKLSAIDKLAKHLNLYKPVEKQPETVYVYLEKEHLDANDRFEDNSFEAEDNAARALEAEQERQLAEREDGVRQLAIRETERRMKIAYENEIEALHRRLNEAEKKVAAVTPATPPGAKGTLGEPIGYRLEQQRNLRRAKPDKYYQGWEL